MPQNMHLAKSLSNLWHSRVLTYSAIPDCYTGAMLQCCTFQACASGLRYPSTMPELCVPGYRLYPCRRTARYPPLLPKPTYRPPSWISHFRPGRSVSNTAPLDNLTTQKTWSQALIMRIVRFDHRHLEFPYPVTLGSIQNSVTQSPTSKTRTQPSEC